MSDDPSSTEYLSEMLTDSWISQTDHDKLLALFDQEGRYRGVTIPGNTTFHSSIHRRGFLESASRLFNGPELLEAILPRVPLTISCTPSSLWLDKRALSYTIESVTRDIVMTSSVWEWDGSVHSIPLQTS